MVSREKALLFMENCNESLISFFFFVTIGILKLFQYSSLSHRSSFFFNNKVPSSRYKGREEQVEAFLQNILLSSSRQNNRRFCGRIISI